MVAQECGEFRYLKAGEIRRKGDLFEFAPGAWIETVCVGSPVLEGEPRVRRRRVLAAEPPVLVNVLERAGDPEKRIVPVYAGENLTTGLMYQEIVLDQDILLTGYEWQTIDLSMAVEWRGYRACVMSEKGGWIKVRFEKLTFESVV